MVRMERPLHPKIPELLLKIWRYRYSEDKKILRALNSLPISQGLRDEINKVNFLRRVRWSPEFTQELKDGAKVIGLDDLFEGMNTLDALIVARDILTDIEVRGYERSNWNHYGD